MGNYSTPGQYYPGSTFDPSKGYVGVRLQQGKPLVDADWNELNDVIRNEVYSGFESLFSDGVMPGDITFRYRGQDQTNPQVSVLPVPTRNPDHFNNIIVAPGRALIQGRPINLMSRIEYSTQPWTDEDRASRDGVPVIPPLLPPETGSRVDLVYLDIWEREVDSKPTDEGGDPSIVNVQIGVETCVRLKRELAVRVSIGRVAFSTQEEMRRELGVGNNHFLMPLALLSREADQTRILDSHIDDIRPRIYGIKGPRFVSFAPAFFPVSLPNRNEPEPPWLLFINRENIVADKSPSSLVATGLLPVILPDGARILTIRVMGWTEGPLVFRLLRSSLEVFLVIAGRPGFPPGKILAGESFSPPEGVSRRVLNETLIINEVDGIVDNSKFNYYVSASATGNFSVRILGIIIEYL